MVRSPRLKFWKFLGGGGSSKTPWNGKSRGVGGGVQIKKSSVMGYGYFLETYIFSFGFWLRKLSQRGSLMAAFLIVYAGSYSGLQEKSFNISNFLIFVFFNACQKLKYHCYQDSSVIRSWLIHLDFGLGKALSRDSTKVKVEDAHLLALRTCIQSEPE